MTDRPSLSSLARRALAPARHWAGVRAHRTITAIVRSEVERSLGAREPSLAAEIERRLEAHVGEATRAALDDGVARAIAAAAAERREAALHEPRSYGPPERLAVAPNAVINDALFNTVSGCITVEDSAFFGHDVAVLTGTHEVTATGIARQQAIPTSGRDILIARGAWIGSRATILGPVTVGEHAVVAAGALVRGDVAPGDIVAGVPARRVGSVTLPPAVPTLDVATDVGRMFVHAHDKVITPCLAEQGSMPEDDLDVVRSRSLPGAAVVDVGANIGYSTLALAAAVGASGRVFAFEPHPDNVTLLRANLARNGVTHVDVVPHPAMDQESEVVLSEATLNTGDHRMWGHDRPGEVVETDGERRRALHLRAVTIDAHVPDDVAVQFMILDTQGSEHVALRGAERTIARCRPELFVEFWPHGIRDRGDEPLDVLRYYAGLGYERRVLEDATLDAVADEALIARIAARPGPSGGYATLQLTPV